MNARDQGLTLLELVVAVALFALVAVMGLQTLTAMMRNRDHLDVRAQTAAETSQAFALLRADLNAAIPMSFRAPDGATPLAAPFSLDPTGNVFAISVSGQPSLSPDGSNGFGRVVWSFDPSAETLTRRSWPVLAPAGAQLESTAMEVLQGVTALSVESYFAQTGWQNGDGAVDGVQSDSLPLAVRLTFATRTLSDLEILVTF
jgi:general secretion pathway protein J